MTDSCCSWPADGADAPWAAAPLLPLLLLRALLDTRLQELRYACMHASHFQAQRGKRPLLLLSLLRSILCPRPLLLLW